MKVLLFVSFYLGIQTATELLQNLYGSIPYEMRWCMTHRLNLSEYYGLNDPDYSVDSEQMEESDDSQIINLFNDSEEEESPSTREEQVTKAKDSLYCVGHSFHSRSQYCCPICMDPPVRPVSTTCGHIYCAKCMRKLFRVAKIDSPYL